MTIDPATLEAFKTIAKAFLTLGGLIKLGKKEQKAIQKNPEAWNHFVNNGNLNGSPVLINNLYLGDLDKLPSELKKRINKRINSNKKIPENKKINFIKYDFKDREENYLATQRKDQISKYLPYLNYDLKKILDLSIYVKIQYATNNSEAHRVKQDIGYEYGNVGRKICNLYTSGYVELLLNYLEVIYSESELKEIVNDQLLHFIENSEYIFFLHQNSEELKTINKLREGLSRKRKYLAIHSTGSNTTKAKSIHKIIEKEIDKKEYTVNIQSFNTENNISVFNVIIISNKLRGTPSSLAPFDFGSGICKK